MTASEKSFDIVVFGASGYTGRLVAEYLQAEYGDTDLRWAMAGRSLEKLAAVRSEMGVSDSVALLEVDVDDPESVIAMVDACKVVITTVGPYQLYGNELVKQCAELGTDYVDLTGEPSWMHETIAQYSEAAKASGHESFTAVVSIPSRLIWGCTCCNNTPLAKRASPSPR